MHKKRRISQTNPKDPSPIRTIYPAGFQNSENQSGAAKDDEPKTSEYAFFKKLKTDAGHRNKFKSRTMNKEEVQPNKFKSSNFYRESSSPTKNSSKDFRLPVEDITNVHSRVLLTPARRSSPTKNSSKEFRFSVEDVTRVNRGSLLTPVGVHLKRASAPFQDIWSTRSRMEESRSLRPAGTPNKHEDLFATKRKKLHHWVADVSFPEIDELCSKGYDFVSALLSRLFPERSEENGFEIPKSKQVDSHKSKLLASPDSNIHLKKLHDMSTRNFMEVESGSYLEYGLSSCWLDSLRERTVSNSDSPTCHAHNTVLDYNLTEPSWVLGGRNEISWIENYSSFSFPFKNYGHLPSSYLRELDDFHDPDDSLLRREQRPVLAMLGWDSENETKERTCLSSPNTELITYPVSLTSCGDDHEQSLDELGPLGASGLCTSSVVCKYSPNFYSLPPSHSTSYYEDEYGRHILEDKDDTVTELNHYPSALSTVSHMPGYPSLTEDCNYNRTFKGSRTLPSPGNHQWFTTEVGMEQHYDPNPEVLSSKLDFHLGRKCLSISESSNKHYSFIHPTLQSPPKEGILTSFLAKDKYVNSLDGLTPRGILSLYGREMVNIHDWPSFCFQISLDKEKVCPLLRDKSMWGESEEEIYNDRNDIEYI